MSQPVIPVFDRLKARSLQVASGKSVAAIAAEMGYERQTVGHWFRGRGEPDMRQMYELAKAMNCHWLELVTEDATVINNPDERRRVDRIRAMDPAKRALLDALLDSMETGDGKK